MPRRQNAMVLSPEQQEAITQSPARLEIIGAMSEIAPSSVAELARELGRSPQSLYYHVQIMVEVGLLRQSGTRRAGKRDEALFDTVSEHFRLVGGGDSAEQRRRALLRFNSTVVKLTERDYRRAITQGLARRVQKRENIYLRRQRGRLSDADLARFYELLDEMGALLAANSAAHRRWRRDGKDMSDDPTHSYALTVALVPLEARTSQEPGDAAPPPAIRKRSRKST